VMKRLDGEIRCGSEYARSSYGDTLDAVHPWSGLLGSTRVEFPLRDSNGGIIDFQSKVDANFNFERIEVRRSRGSVGKSRGGAKAPSEGRQL
jgi:hypothetical protein